MGITVGSGEFRYELVESWPKMPKYWEFGGASDVAVNSIDEIHVFSRGDHPLTIWDTDGNFVSSWGEGSFSDNEHGIFIAPNDQVWLVDANYHIVTKHSPLWRAPDDSGQQAHSITYVHRKAVQYANWTVHRT